MWWVAFDREALTWAGEPAWFATWPTLQRAFCPRCGAATISLTGANLADRSGADLEPCGHSFRDETSAWMSIALAPVPEQK